MLQYRAEMFGGTKMTGAVSTSWLVMICVVVSVALCVGNVLATVNIADGGVPQCVIVLDSAATVSEQYAAAGTGGLPPQDLRRHLLNGQRARWCQEQSFCGARSCSAS